MGPAGRGRPLGALGQLGLHVKLSSWARLQGAKTLRLVQKVLKDGHAAGQPPRVALRLLRTLQIRHQLAQAHLRRAKIVEPSAGRAPGRVIFAQRVPHLILNNAGPCDKKLVFTVLMRRTAAKAGDVTLYLCSVHIFIFLQATDYFFVNKNKMWQQEYPYIFTGYF